MSRGGNKITRNDYETEKGDRIDWIDIFAKTLESAPKSAVEVARQRNQNTVDQISLIMGNRTPQRSSVESVVQDMQERTGLKEYLKRTAQQLPISGQEPEVFATFPPRVRESIINFIKNKIETHHGLIPLPAIQEEILASFTREGVQSQDVNNPEVAKLISKLITEQRQNSAIDVGDINLGKGVGTGEDNSNDAENNDFFKGLLPINKN